MPVYAAFHEWLGRGDELADLWRLWKEGDRKAAAESIPNSVVDQLLVWGKPEQCREHIQRYIDNGVTTPAPALFCGPAELPDVIRALKITIAMGKTQQPQRNQQTQTKKRLPKEKSRPSGVGGDRVNPLIPGGG